MLVDLRSDTVTKPTLKMRAAMAQAVVGDDVYADDPTMNELEAYAAHFIGKQAALFVPSGTMGNQICVMCHTQRGDEIIVEANAHIRKYEQGGAAVLSGVSYATIYSPDGDGLIQPQQVQAAIREKNDFHLPNTGLICMENATTKGFVQSLETMKAVQEVAKKNDLPIHLDGARICNTALYLGCQPKEIADCVDSVMFCLSKGLGAPVGSMVAGSRAFIAKARRARKLLGGGMRQTGILAAAGLVALTDGVARLQEDHDNATFLAHGLRELGFAVAMPNINMLFFDCANIIDADVLVHRLGLQGVLCGSYGGTATRFVANIETDRSKCAYALEAVKQAISNDKKWA